MLERDTIRAAVEGVVAETFDAHVRALHDEVVRRLLDVVTPLLNERPVQSGSASLKAAIDAVESVSQQADVLNALLDGAGNFAGRCALFLLRGPVAIGWHGRGLADNDAVKTVSVSATSPLLAVAVNERHSVKGESSHFDSGFASKLGTPGDGVCALIPLIIREKVAAVLYADAGNEEARLDVPGLEVLVRAAGLWIELNAFRKVSTPSSPSRAEVQQTRHVARAASGVAAAAPSPEPATPVATASANEASAPTPTHHAPSAGEGEVHKKARRFAKLLVDEIVLYNRDKVMEGRMHRDLYERLKEDIDKSRATYDKRYGQTEAAGQDYFRQALISGLADHNAALLGPRFERK